MPLYLKLFRANLTAGNRRNFCRVLVLGMVLMWFGGVTPVRAEEVPNFAPAAADTVRNLTTIGLKILRDKSDVEQKRKQFREVLLANVDVESVIRFLFGRAIKTATPQQKAELTELISEFVVRAYSRNISNFNKYTVNITDSRMDGASALVFTDIIRTQENNNRYQVVWRLVLSDNRPKLVDCILEGISVNVTQKQEFASIMERSGKGLDGVIDVLRERLAKGNQK